MPARRLPRGPVHQKKLDEGIALKDEGMTRAAQGEERQDFLHEARDIAFNIAFDDPDWEVFCDDVRWGLERSDYEIPTSVVPQTYGSILRCKLFEKTDQRRISAHPRNHGHEYAVWRLKLQHRYR